MKNILFLIALALPLLLTSCSKDGDGTQEDVLTGTSWYKRNGSLETSYSFGVNGECHYMFQVDKGKPIISYYKYNIIEKSRVEIYKKNSKIYTGTFDNSTLSITNITTNETEQYTKNNHGL